LLMSKRTADAYRARIMSKTQVKSLAHLVHFAIANDLIPLRKFPAATRPPSPSPTDKPRRYHTNSFASLSLL
jgi:hypothetical protein